MDFRISRYKNQGHKPLTDALITSWIKSNTYLWASLNFIYILWLKPNAVTKGTFFPLFNHLWLPEEVSYIAQKLPFFYPYNVHLSNQMKGIESRIIPKTLECWIWGKS